MAEYLASIFGTEKDKVNCSFYFKIGACRHGDRCSRIHNKPTFSQTCLLQNLYVNPQNSAKSADGSHLVANVSDEEMQEHYDNFFEDVFVECEDKYGEIEEMNVCDNLGDHLVGNVYIKFRREEDAEKAVNDLNNRWFGGRPVYAELSPVTDFREACCRQYEMGLSIPAGEGGQFKNESAIGECTRSGFCNFMHLKPISRELRRYLYSRKKGGKGSSGGGGGGGTGSGGAGGGGGGGGRSRSRSKSPRGRSERKRRSRSRERRSRSKDRNRKGRDDKGRDGRSGRY
ncbi:splicing factor U2af 38 kDa subunit isoform X1 [Athalia rosae]|uniref:splicing factor U2af 38 kDa subunit isoform X1 n=1 Tax=Athalia rosae TaxID=37344 RepID=UPI0020336532|nr:splicing factor U2af 38 kDa subunit isoform X1 [Athalia rosae]